MHVEGAYLSDRMVGHVLVVEDEVLVRFVISDALRDAGYSVIEATSGDEAVEILTSGALIDLVFSDVRMPGAIDGLGLRAFVRKTFPELPVIIASGHFRPDLGFSDGATEFLAKPYGIDQALSLVEATLAKVR